MAELKSVHKSHTTTKTPSINSKKTLTKNSNNHFKSHHAPTHTHTHTLSHLN